ncbi:MAG: hypothetical protein ABGY75_01305, partial [Gemmataceae bacterium]
ECYVRGNTIKYVCVPDEVLDVVKEEMKNRPQGGGRGEGGRGGDKRETCVHRTNLVGRAEPVNARR